jgi:hypothetical protein
MQRTDLRLLLLIFPWKCLSYCLKLSCLWTFYSTTCSLCYPLDVSVLAAAMNVSVHSSLCCWTCLFYCRQCCPWTCSFYSTAAACAVYWHGQVSSTAVCAALDVYVLLQPLLLLDMCVLYGRLCCPCACLFYSILCSPGHVCSTAVCASLYVYSMLKNDSEHISESSLCSLFHGMEFRAYLSFSEWFGTEFREFSVPRNSRNSVGINHLVRLFRLPRNNYFVGNCQP